MKIHINTKHKRDSPAGNKFFSHRRSETVTSMETTVDDHHRCEQVDLSQLFLGPRFDAGAHAQIYHGNYKDESVAVKISKVPDDYDHDEKSDLSSRIEKQFNQESTLLSRLHHPNVLKFVAIWKQPPVFGMITEYLSRGSLRTHLNKFEHEHKFVPLPKLIAMALDIARGMAYIHSQGIVHRDLKPDNILISEDFDLKIADFGVTCEEANCHLLANGVGSLRWMAPEMIKRKKSYNRKIDVYGFGLILYEMIAGSIPFKGMEPEQVAFAVLHKNLRPSIPQHCPPATRDLIVQCWSSKPEKRPEFWQIVKVLEQFETSLARDGTLDHVVINNPISCDQELKKGLLHWMHKLDPIQLDRPIISTA